MAKLVQVNQEDLARLLARLDRAAQYVGRTPGEAQSEEAIKAAMSGATTPQKPPVKPEPVEPATLFSLLGDTAILLEDAGFVNLEMVRDATDEELLSISGVGTGKLRKIREAVQ